MEPPTSELETLLELDCIANTSIKLNCASLRPDITELHYSGLHGWIDEQAQYTLVVSETSDAYQFRLDVQRIDPCPEVIAEQLQQETHRAIAYAFQYKEAAIVHGNALVPKRVPFADGLTRLLPHLPIVCSAPTTHQTSNLWVVLIHASFPLFFYP
jgi:hypothetical protein